MYFVVILLHMPLNRLSSLPQLQTTGHFVHAIVSSEHNIAGSTADTGGG